MRNLLQSALSLSALLAAAWQTPPHLPAWDDLDAVVSDKYASFTNGAAILPPFFSLVFSAGFFTFESQDEIAAVTNVFDAGSILGVPVWKIRVTETQATERVWLFYGGTNEVAFRTNAVPVGFDPNQWVQQMYGTQPAWLTGEKLDKWYRWRDRSRMQVGMTLMASNDWPVFIEAIRTAAMNNPSPQTPPPTLPADTNRLSFVGIGRCDSQTMRLWLYSPADQAPVDLFGSSVLPPPSNRWSLIGSAPAGEPFSSWEQPLNGGRSFFHAARNDIDSDGDGIPDDREILLFLTYPDKADSDFDGLSDREELYRYETDPNAGDSDGDGVWDGEDQSPLVPGPLIAIMSPGEGALLNNPLVTVTGVIIFDGELDMVLVRGIRADFHAQGDGTYAFTNIVNLSEGTYDIAVRAVSGDAIPLESKKTVTVTIDALPSDITILSPLDLTSIEGTNVHVTVWTECSNDVVTVNGSSTTRDGYIRYAWATLTALGTNVIQATAVDALNRTRADSVAVNCTSLSGNKPADDDNDGVPNQEDPDPNDPRVRSTVVITFPPNGEPITVR